VNLVTATGVSIYLPLPACPSIFVFSKPVSKWQWLELYQSFLVYGAIWLATTTFVYPK
jgi:hypothetical protein